MPDLDTLADVERIADAAAFRARVAPKGKRRKYSRIAILTRCAALCSRGTQERTILQTLLESQP